MKTRYEYTIYYCLEKLELLFSCQIFRFEVRTTFVQSYTRDIKILLNFKYEFI